MNLYVLNVLMVGPNVIFYLIESQNEIIHGHFNVVANFLWKMLHF
jgi:hypothetical protein